MQLVIFGVTSAKIGGEMPWHRPNGVEIRYEVDRHHCIVASGASSPMIYAADVADAGFLG